MCRELFKAYNASAISGETGESTGKLEAISEFCWQRIVHGSWRLHMLSLAAFSKQLGKAFAHSELTSYGLRQCSQKCETFLMTSLQCQE